MELSLIIYKTNKGKAYAFLFGQCSKVLQAKIMERKDYDNSQRNPIKLLQTIKEVSLSYQDTKYDMKIVTQAIKNMVNLKQKDDESLLEYTTRFKAAKDMLKAHLGDELVMHKVVRNDPDFIKEEYTAGDREKNKKLIRKHYDRWLAYLLLENCDKNKYGTLVNGLDSQQALGNNQYPKTIATATEVLSNHKFDQAYHDAKKRRSNQRARDRDNPPNDTTREGQDATNPMNMSFANIEGTCYCCGKPGHKSPACRLKDKIPRSEWAINKAAQKANLHVHTTVNNSSDSSTNSANTHTNTSTNTNTNTNNNTTDTSSITTTSTTNSSNTAWTFVQVGHQLSSVNKHQDLHDLILLDNQSSEDLFSNEKMVKDIHQVQEVLQLHTNGGTIDNNLKAELPNFGKVWYNPQAIANILSFAKMKDRGNRITYDSDLEDAFVIHTKNGIVKFERTPNNLYAMDPKQYSKYMLLDTVEENALHYTKRQIEKAKQTRALYHALGTPTVNDFKAILRMNAIRNCPITMADVDIAEAIYGKDIGAIKGKTVRKKPTPVVRDYIQIPKEIIQKHQDITLCIDTMYINEMPFLATISKNIKYRTIQWLPTRTARDYRSALDAIFRQYNKAGFRIATIHCDGEFRSIMDDIKDDLDIDMNYASAQEHVPEAERNNRVIKERVRAAYHRLPYQSIPKVMIKVLAMESTNKLNFFPPKGGISPYYSPRMILTNEALDYAKHCSTPFGTYVQAHNENNPTNTMAPRALDCIYLRPVYNQQGGHELLDLHTKRIITRRHITPVPITPSIIASVEQMANDDNMHGIKFLTHTGTILYDSSWITGVDYDEDEDDFDYETDDDEEDQEEEEETDEYDQIDPEEIAELLEENNENETEEENEQDEQEEDDNVVQPETVQEDAETVESVPVRRSERTRVQTTNYEPSFEGQQYNHLLSQSVDKVQYDMDLAKIAALYIDHMNEVSLEAQQSGLSFLETYNLKKGLKKFGQSGEKAAHKEMKQLHDRVCFRPIDPNTMTELERKRALESLIFLVQKKSGEVKARTVANGSAQRVWMHREETSSPTVSTAGLFMTLAVDAKEDRHVVTCDIPNAFIQTEMEKYDKDGQRHVMKIRGPLVDMLVQIAPETYKNFVSYKRGQKILYVQVLKAIYGMLQSALLFYKKIRNDLIENGFEINPYDPCVANKMVNGYQITVVWHVDDLKASHKQKQVIDKFVKWVKDKYGAIGEVKVVYGLEHVYLGMNFDFTIDKSVRINMTKYVKEMLEDYPEQLKGKSKTPANEKLFRVNDSSTKLDREKAEVFHTFVAKGLFLSKRARPDIQTVIAFLCTRVQQPNVEDWYKLHRLMDYLKRTKNDCLVMTMDNTSSIKWYIDVAYAVHPDMRSHTGAVMTLGKGAISSISSKQKVNARSSTEAELIGVDDVISQVLWAKLFMESQGISIKENIIYQDNKSTILLAENGRQSVGKRSRHLNIKYFYITDQLERKEVEIQYCPTDDMVADFNTKPLQGSKFVKFKRMIMNE